MKTQGPKEFTDNAVHYLQEHKLHEVVRNRRCADERNTVQEHTQERNTGQQGERDEGQEKSQEEGNLEIQDTELSY